MLKPNDFHLNYRKVPVVAFSEAIHPAFFIRDLTGYTAITQSLSGMASEDIGERYVESVINRLFSSEGGARHSHEDAFQLADPGNGEPEGGELRIVRFEPQDGSEVSPQQVAEIGSTAVDIVQGLIDVESDDSRKNPTPITTYTNVVSYHALPPEYIELYSAQK